MEVQHSEVMRLANEMGQTITRLKKSLSEKEGYTGLAHTRYLFFAIVIILLYTI